MWMIKWRYLFILYGQGLCLVLLETSETRQVFNDSTQSHRGVVYYTHLEA